MAVKIGHASISETGRISGGKAGDQTGKEVFTRTWYKHSKGWRVFRPKDSEAAEKIAKCMEMACANNKIGYDQNQRNTLYKAAEPYNFDVSKVKTAVETDCSALVRVCCAYAGIMLSDFNTSTEPSRLLSSGKFTELKETKHTNTSDYLKRGDILCTKVKGHTLVILSNGSKTGANNVVVSNVIKFGDKGNAVKEIQKLLIGAGYELSKYGADGDFGEETLKAIKSFQNAYGLTVDGIVGEKTLTALKAVQSVKTVIVTGGTVNVRKGAGTKYDSIGTVNKGDEFKYISTASNGWFKILRNGEECYISNKYSEIK